MEPSTIYLLKAFRKRGTKEWKLKFSSSKMTTDTTTEKGVGFRGKCQTRKLRNRRIALFAIITPYTRK